MHNYSTSKLKRSNNCDNLYFNDILKIKGLIKGFYNFKRKSKINGIFVNRDI